MMSKILEIKGLAKSFGRTRVFSNLALSLEPGKVYGLLGKNGEGKTTLIRILMGVIPADAGEVFYKSEKLTFNSASYKHDVGYIPEDSFFFNAMRVGELMDFNSSFYPRWDGRRADEFLKRFSLDKRTRVRALSRGMKLKLEMAVALAARPELLILDDPTSGLDVPTRYDFLQDIVRELADAGTTIFFATHLVHELERIVEHVFILDRGRLILDRDYQTLKDSVRRLRLSFENPPPEDFAIEGILTERRDGRRAELVVYPWTEEKKRKVEEFSPSDQEIEALSLEEIFRAFVAD
ncbi:MAG: ABC transporter ATP-binding protein [Acidobacteriota bacterium]